MDVKTGKIAVKVNPCFTVWWRWNLSWKPREDVARVGLEREGRLLETLRHE
jgi:hypothetical protein